MLIELGDLELTKLFHILTNQKRLFETQAYLKFKRIQAHGLALHHSH